MAEVHISALKRIWGHFGLNCDHPHLMVTSQWQSNQRTSTPFLIYRWIMTFLSLSMVVVSVSQHCINHAPVIWLIYLTHWTLILQISHFSLAAIIATMAWKRDGDNVAVREKRMCFTYKASWVLGNAAIAVGIWITFAFWTLVYDPKVDELTAILFFTHGFNSAMVMVDFMVAARPCHLAHFFHPAFVLVLYTIFTLAFWWTGSRDTAGNHYIYAVVDWSIPLRTSLVVVGSITLVIFIHGLLCGVYYLRLRLARHLGREMRHHVTSNGLYHLAGENGSDHHGFLWTISDDPQELEEKQNGAVAGKLNREKSTGFGMPGVP